MSFWIELHCDTLGDGQNACGEGTCLAKNGNQPGEMAANASSVGDVLRLISDNAIADGWIRKQGQWTCPACKRWIAEQAPTTKEKRSEK